MFAQCFLLHCINMQMHIVIGYYFVNEKLKIYKNVNFLKHAKHKMIWSMQLDKTTNVIDQFIWQEIPVTKKIWIQVSFLVFLLMFLSWELFTCSIKHVPVHSQLCFFFFFKRVLLSIISEVDHTTGSRETSLISKDMCSIT